MGGGGRMGTRIEPGCGGEGRRGGWTRAARIPPPPGRLPRRRLRGNGLAAGAAPPPPLRRSAAAVPPPIRGAQGGRAALLARCCGGRPGAATLRFWPPPIAGTNREEPPVPLPGVTLGRRRCRRARGQRGAEMVPLVRSAGGSHQWLAIVFLGLCCLLPPGRLAAPGGDYPGAAVDNLVVRKGDTAVLR